MRVWRQSARVQRHPTYGLPGYIGQRHVLSDMSGATSNNSVHDIDDNDNDDDNEDDDDSNDDEDDNTR